MPPTTEQFRDALRRRFGRAADEGKSSLDVCSGDLHEQVGGYPGAGHQLPICCRVMRGEMAEGDREITAPPQGDGASLVIRYMLPRNP